MLLLFFKKSEIDVFMRQLQNNLFGQRILLLIHQAPIGLQSVKTIAIGMYEQSVLRTGDANVIAPQEFVRDVKLSGDKHIHIVELTAFRLMYGCLPTE